ncbi:hypothetical protein ACFGVR_04560 [Mucilaginibacter sp. AW1-3]
MTEKKIWLSPQLEIISQADIHSKSNPGANEKSYQPAGGGKYVNPTHGTQIPKTVFTAYIS